MNKKKLYEEAIKKWGYELQINMCIEECAELIKALMKGRRNPTNPILADKILEEMVDVEIMIEQLKLIFDYKYSNGAISKFADIKRRKLERLEKLLNGD